MTGHPSTTHSATLFQGLFAAYPDALLVVDLAGIIVTANPAACQLLGYTIDQITGLSVDTLVPDAIRPRHASYREAYAHNPKPRPMGTHMELVAKRRDGSEVMVEIALSPLREQGLPFVVAAVRGIESYPRVRQALQRAHYSELVARMGRLAVDNRDPRRLLDELPGVAAEALGVDSAAIYLLEPNRQDIRLASASGLDERERGERTVLANGPGTLVGCVLSQGVPVIVEDASAEQRFKLMPGFASAVAVPLSDQGQAIGVLAVGARQLKQFGSDEVQFLQSLAHLLTSSLQRAQSEDALKHAQRLESVGQLTGGIAHDFNNLLTVIQGNLQVLAEQPALRGDATVEPMLAAAMRASRRGAELTGKLLAFASRQALSPRRVDVSALVTALADMLRRTVDQHVRIEVQTPPLVACVADAGQLEAALLNLAINARDAMPGGGKLTFTSRICHVLTDDEAADLGVSVDLQDAYIAIGVTDTGQGMSDAVREHAFEPFFTTKELGRGTGLGLSTVYGFVKQSKGAVQLQSIVGEGTTITLLLPRFRDASGDQAAHAERSEALPVGLRVVLVEDEVEVRHVVRSHLQALGCTVVEFANAEQALVGLGVASQHDLLLTDIALGPGMRGTQLALRVQQRWPRLAVLTMSGYSSELPQGEGAESPVLRKPFDRQQLAHALAQAVAARDARMPSALIATAPDGERPNLDDRST